MQTLHFHHVGIPVNEKMPEMDYSESLKMYTTDYFANLYDIEWMYFDHDNTLPKIIKETPHVAYAVDNLLEAIKNKKIVRAPESPTDGVTMAFILEGKKLIELIQFDRQKNEIWPYPNKFKI
jgi:hypothetical protein